MGLLFGAKLLASGVNVHFWTKSINQAEQLSKMGLKLETLQVETVKLTNGTYEAFQKQKFVNRRSDEELVYVVLAVKQTSLTHDFLSLLSQLMTSYSQGVLVLLQNGYGHLDKIQSYMTNPIITMITSEAALRVDQAVVRHTGAGQTIIGDQLKRDTTSNYEKNIREILEKAGFQVFVSKNIIEAIYSKLLVNAVINPLTALFRVTNGELPQEQGRLQLMRKLYDETKQVLCIEVPELDKHLFEQILHICESTSANRSSMLCDVEANAITEIESINGAVVRIASKQGISAPLNTSLVQLIVAFHPE